LSGWPPWLVVLVGVLFVWSWFFCCDLISFFCLCVFCLWLLLRLLFDTSLSFVLRFASCVVVFLFFCCLFYLWLLGWRFCPRVGALWVFCCLCGPCASGCLVRGFGFDYVVFFLSVCIVLFVFLCSVLCVFVESRRDGCRM